MAKPAFFPLQQGRILLDMKEKLKANVDCANPTYNWSPTGQTTQEVYLQHSNDFSVDVDCGSCGGIVSADHCFPILYTNCDYGSTLDPLQVPCDGNVNSVTKEILLVEHSCPSDALDWNNIQFSYLNAPAGITGFSTGVAGEVEVEVDTAVVKTGVYYIAAKVATVGGIFSNWVLLRIIVGLSSFIGGSYEADFDGNCCNP